MMRAQKQAVEESEVIGASMARTIADLTKQEEKTATMGEHHTK